MPSLTRKDSSMAYSIFTLGHASGKDIYSRISSRPSDYCTFYLGSRPPRRDLVADLKALYDWRRAFRIVQADKRLRNCSKFPVNMSICSRNFGLEVFHDGLYLVAGFFGSPVNGNPGCSFCPFDVD